MVTAGLLLCICGIRQDTKGRRFSAHDYADKQIEETLNMVERIDIDSYISRSYIRFADRSRNIKRN